MEDKEILQKCIQKVKNNGFKLSELWILDDNELWLDFKEKIIFSHDFAKAFWGDEEVDDTGRDLHTAWEELWKNEGQHMDKEDFENDFGFDIETKVAWRYHLEKMVTMEEPLKYLEKFL